jgi:pimeloyl-ACP methyl ester carboxylesterase
VAARLSAVLALAIALACGGSGAPAALTHAPCPLRVPPGAEADCFRLRVPESRARPNGAKLSLAVVAFHSRAARPLPDPMPWLAGGPGGSAVVLTMSPDLYRTDVAPYLGRRDVIVLEQRGNRYTSPNLVCREGEGDRDCLLRLAAAGRDLRAYTSAASADDIEDLRRALGIERWNVLGESYGTRVAQTLMRDHPGHLRSVVLDSVISIPDDSIAETSAEVARGFERLFAGCAADVRCHAAYPDLEATLRAAFERLERTPLRLAGRAFGRSYDLRLDGARLLSWVNLGLYETAAIPLLPRAIDAAARGRLDPVWRALAENWEVAIPQLLARGLLDAVYCNEEVPFTDERRLEAVDAANAGVSWLFSGRSYLELCAELPPFRPDPIESRPVRSDAPTLLLTGEYDPVTPPDESRRAARTLTHAYLFEFPGLGHWVNPVHPCPRQILLAFLDTPSRRPDAACIRRMTGPRWALG